MHVLLFVVGGSRKMYSVRGDGGYAHQEQPWHGISQQLRHGIHAGAIHHPLGGVQSWPSAQASHHHAGVPTARGIREEAGRIEKARDNEGKQKSNATEGDLRFLDAGYQPRPSSDTYRPGPTSHNTSDDVRAAALLVRAASSVVLAPDAISAHADSAQQVLLRMKPFYLCTQSVKLDYFL
jgi:hypothetical protein